MNDSSQNDNNTTITTISDNEKSDSLNDNDNDGVTKSDENKSNFWELITDVAKDLDLALQDLSPDLEISANITNGITSDDLNEQCPIPAFSDRKESDPILFESSIVRITGHDNASKDDDRAAHRGDTSSLSFETPHKFDEISLESPPSPAPSLPTVSSVASPQSGSYSSQLLTVMGANKLSDCCKPDAAKHCIDNNQFCNRVTPSPASCSSVDPKSSVKDNSGEGDEHSGGSTDSIPACIGLLERLMRTHPIWFLPEIGRASVVHLLQGKDPGCFIVRQSSKSNTMALSVRLPEGRGPHVEHYLIEDAGNGKLHLEGSENHFTAVPMLVCHYCQCCDELPVQLTLPKVLSQSSRPQLTSLSLLGQDFWQSALSKLTADSECDNYSISSNSISRKTLSTFVGGQHNGQQNGSSNSASTCKSLSPPLVLQKHDATHLDPIIDPKKSSTVPIAVVMAQQQCTQQQCTPKLPPRSTEPPPIPPRTTKLLLKQLPQTQSSSSSTITNTNSTSSNNITVTTTVSVSVNALSVAPNTEVTLIDMNEHTQRLSTCSSSASITSQVTNNNNNHHKSTIISDDKNPQTLVKCYRSSLEDKVSDYEDIWGATNTSSKLTLNSTLDGIEERDDSLLTREKYHQMGTQTDENSPLKHLNSKRPFSSPFYTEPIDAIPSNGFNFLRTAQHRRSDTNLNDSCLSYRPSLKGYSLESLIDTLKCHSLQRDTCTQLFNAKNPNLFQDASVQVGNSAVSKSTHTHEWPIDPSWEWLNDGILSLRKKQFDNDNYRRSKYVESMKSDVTTIEDLILLNSPELNIETVKPLTKSNLNSFVQSNGGEMNYDNLAIYRVNNKVNDNHDDRKELKRQQSTNTDTDTEFSEPWDSEWWDCILHKVFPRNAIIQLSPDTDDNTLTVNSLASLIPNKDHIADVNSTLTSISGSTRTSAFDMTEENSSYLEMPSINTSINRKSHSSKSECPTAVEKPHDDSIGLNVCNYIFKLASDGDNTFAKAIDHFIECTIESTETNPTIIMRNIRQFMNGIKNYLIKHGEGQFNDMIQIERSKLKANEFLNIDSILENALHKLVIKPLKNHLYQLLVNEYNRNGSLKVLSKNIKEAQLKTPLEIGIRSELQPPDAKAMIAIQKHLCNLQKAYSPLKKLEYLLTAISTIYNSVRQQQFRRSRRDINLSIGADEFLPIFVYVLIKCGCISLEAEADYMFGLLHPSILSGEGGYYLTALSSAISILKTMITSSECNSNNSTFSNVTTNTKSTSSSAAVSDQLNASLSNTSITSVNSQSSPPHQNTQTKLPSISDLQGYMKIIFPDELSCNIIAKTLPVRPHMTTKEVCKMIALKFKITNPEDYGLFKLINGDENQLYDNDIPQIIKSEFIANGVECYFTYKRCDAKFIWPITKLEVISPSSN